MANVAELTELASGKRHRALVRIQGLGFRAFNTDMELKTVQKWRQAQYFEYRPLRSFLELPQNALQNLPGGYKA